MRSLEDRVDNSSQYFIYTPSATALTAFFYPLHVGRFVYLPGYCLNRNSFDSFQLICVKSGQFTLEQGGKTQEVFGGQFVLLDCYAPHSYYSDTGWESIWLHFDGPTARRFYELIVTSYGNVFTLPDPFVCVEKLQKIYDTFAGNLIIREPLLSKLITDLLTHILLSSTNVEKQAPHWNAIEETFSYINEHFMEEIKLTELAERAMMSQYHFIRTFKKETGYTPHAYIVNLRISTAKYLLKTTELPLKDICYNVGFASESAFCSSFKKSTGKTPMEYRNSINLKGTDKL